MMLTLFHEHKKGDISDKEGGICVQFKDVNNAISSKGNDC